MTDPAQHHPQAAPVFSPARRRALQALVAVWWGSGVDRPARAQAQTALPAPLRSSDGRWWLAASATGEALHLTRDGDGPPLRSWPARMREPQQPGGGVAWLADAVRRRSFLIGLRGQPQVWELSYDERAQDIYEGMVHDFRMGEGVPLRGYLNPRRITLAAPLAEPVPDVEDTQWFAPGPGGLEVLHLDVRRRIATLPGLALPEPWPGAATAWQAPPGPPLLAWPVPGLPQAVLLDTHRLHLHSRLLLPAPAWAARSHPASPWVWFDSRGGDGRSLTLCDKAEPSRQQQLALPRPQADALRFSADGREAWVPLVGQPAGAPLRLDARTGNTM